MYLGLSHKMGNHWSYGDAYIGARGKALRSVLSSDRKTIHLIPTWQDTDVLQSLFC